MPLQTYFAEPVCGGYYPGSYELEQDLEKAASTYLDAQAEALRKRGVRLEASLRRGPAAFQIIEAAKENAGSLIVMSTHGRTGIGRTLLGSVAGAVVREAGHPVLVVRATGPANTAASAARQCAVGWVAEASSRPLPIRVGSRHPRGRAWRCGKRGHSGGGRRWSG